MKTYESEKQFTEMFANDVNNGVKEYSVNGIEFKVSNKTKNASNAAVYHVAINGTNKEVTIMQLKKLLNVTYKKEYNRTSDRATAAGTKVTIKTDEELQATVDNIKATIDADIDRLIAHCNKYGVRVSLNFEGADIANTWYDRARTIRNNKLAADEAAKKKKEEEKAAKVESVAELAEELQKALGAGNLALVAELSAKMAKAAK